MTVIIEQTSGLRVGDQAFTDITPAFKIIVVDPFQRLNPLVVLVQCHLIPDYAAVRQLQWASTNLRFCTHWVFKQT